MDEKTIARFWSKVDIRPCTECCWNWLGLNTRQGYGAITATGKTYGSHRFAWIATHGPIPPGRGYHGTCVRHKCDNRSCCNPRHLELGSHFDNIQDRVARGRKGDVRGIKNGRSLLASHHISAIRQAKGILPCTELAAMYGVSAVLISRIWRGGSWTHV